MTLRNGPGREQSGLCLIDNVSKICRSPETFGRKTPFINSQYRYMQELDRQLGRKTAFIHWFQVQYFVPRTMVTSMRLLAFKITQETPGELSFDLALLCIPVQVIGF